MNGIVINNDYDNSKVYEEEVERMRVGVEELAEHHVSPLVTDR